MFTTKDVERKYHSIVVQDWTDKEFHDRLVKNPREALKEHGVEFPDHVDVAVKHGATRGKVEVAIPSRPPGLSDDDIKSGKNGDGPDFCIC